MPGAYCCCCVDGGIPLAPTQAAGNIHASNCAVGRRVGCAHARVEAAEHRRNFRRSGRPGSGQESSPQHGSKGLAAGEGNCCISLKRCWRFSAARGGQARVVSSCRTAVQVLADAGMRSRRGA